MKKQNDGIVNAFPQSVSHNDAGGAIASYDFANGEGMSLRAYFAAKAMEGLIAGRWTDEPYSEEAHKSPKRTARRAIEYADALIKELGE